MRIIANLTYRSLTVFLFGFAVIVGRITPAQEPEEQDKIVPIEIQEQVKELFEKCFAHRQLIKSGTMRIVHTLSGYKKKKTAIWKMHGLVKCFLPLMKRDSV